MALPLLIPIISAGAGLVAGFSADDGIEKTGETIEKTTDLVKWVSILIFIYLIWRSGLIGRLKLWT